MNDHAAPNYQKLFRSALLYPVTALYVLGALLGLAAVATLFLPGSVNALISDLISRGIADRSAIRTWTVINIGLMLVGAACTTMMAVGILLDLRRKGDGLELMYHSSEVLLVLAKVGGVAALVVIVWRLVRYLLNCDRAYSGIYQAYSLLLSEGIMIAQAVGMFALLLRFLDNACDAAASMAYSRACEKLDDRPIPDFCATGFFLLAVINTHLAWDWLATLYMDGGFRVELATHPMQLLAGGMFACAAVSNLLVFLYLKRYKRITEQMVYQLSRET